MDLHTIFNNPEFLKKAEKLPYGQWVTPKRATAAGDNGLYGNDIEVRLGVPINNLKAADFGSGKSSVEIKSKSNETSSLLTLFSKNPTHWESPLCNVKAFGKRGANYHLVNRFGYKCPDEDVKYYRGLNLTMMGNKETVVNGEFGVHHFNITQESDSARLNIFDDSKTLVFRAHWTNHVMFNAVKSKLGANLAYFHYDTREESGEKQYRLTSFDVYTDFSQACFNNSLLDGTIKIDCRMKLKRKNGRPRDHGTGFRILEADLPKLYGQRVTVYGF